MLIQTTEHSGFSMSKVVAFALCGILLFIGYLFYPLNILCWDVFGYYLYLPLTLIYHDLGLKDHAIIDGIIQKYNNTGSFYQAFESPTGDWVMRYPIGLSILYSPFFFIGHLAAKIGGYPADGFSAPYQFVIWTGSMLFAFAGVFFLRKVLLKFFEDKMAALLLVALVLGTNYTLHTSVHGQGAMPHDYLFTLYAIILWLTIRWHESYKIKHAILLAITCGLAALSRPSEAVALIIPLMWGVYNKETLLHKIKLLKEKISQLIVFAIALTAMGFIQFTYWKIYTGKFIFDSYYNPGEGLDLFPPHTINSLFSFRNGWFIYTPVMVLAMIGFYFLYKKDRSLFTPIFAYFIINLLIVTSWTVWWNGPSFGQRYLIASYPAMAIPMGYCFMNLSKGFYKYILVLIAAICVSLNLFQSWQMANGILPTPRMTKDAYFASFGATEIPEGLEKMLHIDALAPEASDIDPKEYERTKEYTEGFEDHPNSILDSALSKTHLFKMDSVSVYSPSLEKRYDKLTTEDHVKLKVSAQIYNTADKVENPGSLVVTFEHNGKAYGYKATDIEAHPLEPNTWTTVSLNYLTPVVRNGRDKLKVYYWHRGKKPLYIDDLKVEVWEHN
ncbi:MAG: hypothetical protein EPN85_04265 [Bacteroidetes bacterium]|nr:MAG: hypothetical protein EPN85_04265 [Bacteroidota bacterium]